MSHWRKVSAAVYLFCVFLTGEAFAGIDSPLVTPGNYFGLIQGSDRQSTGYARAVIGPGGSGTLILNLGEKRSAVRVITAVTGNDESIIHSLLSRAPMTVQLKPVVLSGNVVLRGTITRNGVTVDVTLHSVVPAARFSGGKYTVVFENRSSIQSFKPGIIGAGAFEISGKGRFQFVGTLGDGSMLMQGGWLTKSGNWVLYAKTKQGGFLTGEVSFAETELADCSGTLSWLSGASGDSTAARSELIVLGSHYEPSLPWSSALVWSLGASDNGGITANFSTELWATGAPGPILMDHAARAGVFLHGSTGLIAGGYAMNLTDLHLLRGAFFQKTGHAFGFTQKINSLPSKMDEHGLPRWLSQLPKGPTGLTQAANFLNTMDLGDAGTFFIEPKRTYQTAPVPSPPVIVLVPNPFFPAPIPVTDPGSVSDPVQSVITNPAEIHPVKLGPAAFAINALALDLYRKLIPDQDGGNLCLSPYSIQSALVMTYAGAAKVTKSEMASVLHYGHDDAALHSSFVGLRNDLERIAADSVTRAKETSSDPIELKVANRLFGQEGFNFETPFLDFLSQEYRAPLVRLNFAQNEAAAKFINDWIAEQTHQRILNLVPSAALDEFTRLVLVNAIYLKAPWEIPFAPELTEPKPFYSLRNGLEQVPTMTVNRSLGYVKFKDCTVITIPYAGSDLQFLVLMPDEGKDLTEFEAELTDSRLAECAGLPAKDLLLSLPKFELKSPVLALTGPLQSLGMKTAFDIPKGTADFDLIAPRTPFEYLKLSNVFHKTFFAVNEKGTEAAAATAAIVATVTSIANPLPPLPVTVDRPFLFAIQHRASGACLFLGRVTDPLSN